MRYIDRYTVCIYIIRYADIDRIDRIDIYLVVVVVVVVVVFVAVCNKVYAYIYAAHRSLEFVFYSAPM